MAASAPTARDVALIGAGDWGKHLARCFETLGSLRTIVVLSDGEAAALGHAFPNADLSASFAQALADPGVRKVVIATPSATHFELARAALRAGKDVFVEKPLCLRAAHGEVLTQLAQESGLTLMVGHLLQYHPSVVRLQALVAEGALGRLLTITSNRLNLGKFRTEENALYSFAPHDVSVVLSLRGEQSLASVRCVGASYVKPGVADSTTTFLKFSGGTLAQLYVSWLNPFKEQKLTVVGTLAMAVFDDTKPWSEKLMLYRDYMSRADAGSASNSCARGEAQLVAEEEPLMAECVHFLRACADRSAPRTDGREGVRVLRVLDLAQQSLERDGALVTPTNADATSHADYFAHPSAIIEPGSMIGAGSKIWHFCHIMAGARLGERASLGQNVFVAGGVVVGPDVKVQNNVSLYDGVELERDVFVGPSCVFTNVKHPRAEISQRGSYVKTVVRRGASLGANATVVCGVTLGSYCFVGAGAVVTRDVPDYALVVGNPARRVGWVGRHGQRLAPSATGTLACPQSGLRYREIGPDQLVCLDPDQDAMPGQEP